MDEEPETIEIERPAAPLQVAHPNSTDTRTAMQEAGTIDAEALL